MNAAHEANMAASDRRKKDMKSKQCLMLSKTCQEGMHKKYPKAK